MRINRKLIKSASGTIQNDILNKKNSNIIDKIKPTILHNTPINKIEPIQSCDIPNAFKNIDNYKLPTRDSSMVLIKHNYNNINSRKNIEQFFIDEKFKNIENRNIAFFKCLENNKLTKYINNIPSNNNCYLFDNDYFNNINYYQVDFNNKIYKEESFDYGICFSLLEYLGLPNKQDNNMDISVLKNIINTIKKDGTLYVSVPISEKFYYPLHWMKCYSIALIKFWEKLINCKIKIDCYQLIKNEWFLINNVSYMSYHFKGEYDICAIAILEIKKKYD